MLSENDVRRIALSMPESAEDAHFDSASFCVNKKMFCTLAPGAERVTIKLSSEDQANLAADNPAAISPVRGYWGRKGWTEVVFGDLAEDRLTVMMRLSWATVAPRRLLRQ